MRTTTPSVSRTARLVVLLLMPTAMLNDLDRQMLAANITSSPQHVCPLPPPDRARTPRPL